MNDAGKLEICEIFRSISGETTFAGLPATLVRLAGCNLRCNWCDTHRAWASGRQVFTQSVIDLAVSTGDRLVIVTGGEPLMQPGTIGLCAGLVGAGRTVLLETNGSLDISPVPDQVHVIMDLKPPGSGQHHKMDLANLNRLEAGDELKMVVSDRRDFDWCLATLDSNQPADGVEIIFSPAAKIIEPASLADWLLESGRQARIQLQLHEILWPGGGDRCRILDVTGIPG